MPRKNTSESLADITTLLHPWILELLAYQGITEGEQKIIEDFVNQCKVITLNNSIKKETIRVRKNYKTKLPDSIIIASALYLDLPLITSDVEFKKVDELILIQYEY